MIRRRSIQASLLVVHWHSLDNTEVQVACVNQKLHSRSNLGQESLIGANRVVQISQRKVDNHASNLWCEFITDHACHVAENVRSNNLLLLLISSSTERLVHKHSHDLLPEVICFHKLRAQHIWDLLRHKLRHRHMRWHLDWLGHLLIHRSLVRS